MTSQDVKANDPRAQHSLRFRQVSTLYPRMVAFAYGRDLAAAMADSDEEVAATVAAWEQAEGLPVRDWRAIGAYERDEGNLDGFDDDGFGLTAQAVTR